MGADGPDCHFHQHSAGGDFTNLPGFFSLLGAIGKILSPLVSGIVIAFLLNPIVNFVDLRLRPILKKRGMKEGKADKLSRAVALVFSFIFAAFIVYAFFAMLLPQLYESVTSIVNSAPEYYQSLEKWAVNVLEDNPEIRLMSSGRSIRSRAMWKTGSKRAF